MIQVSDNEVPGTVFSPVAWSIKASFVSYVDRLPDGSCEIADDLKLLGDGIFGFPGVVERSKKHLIWKSRAWVCFRGHSGLLEVPIHAPEIWLEEEVGLLSVTNPRNADTRINIAHLSVVHKELPHLALTPTLTGDGTELFGGNYSQGEALDDIHLYLEG